MQLKDSFGEKVLVENLHETGRKKRMETS